MNDNTILPDLGKVICGLECCSDIKPNSCVKKCPYRDEGCRNAEKLMKDAITLLKCQEADIKALCEKYAELLDRTLETEEPKAIREPLVVGGHLMGKCPKCYKVLNILDHPVACGFCGEKVKWDG